MDLRGTVTLALAGMLVLAGCLGAADPSPTNEASDHQRPGTGADGGIFARSSLEAKAIGLWTFTGVDRSAVAAYVPEPLEPIPCFSDGSQGLDVVLVVSEEAYPDLGLGPVHLLSLLTCTSRPGGLALAEGNEPPWFTLMTWSDDPAYQRFLAENATPPQPATFTYTAEQGALAFTAEDPNGTALARGTLAAPGIGLPGGETGSCEPERYVGRVVSAGPDGQLGAVDWVKTETICPAGGTVAWEAASPVAGVLGPAAAATFTFHTSVQEGEVTWRTLGTLADLPSEGSSAESAQPLRIAQIPVARATSSPSGSSTRPLA